MEAPAYKGANLIGRQYPGTAGTYPLGTAYLNPTKPNSNVKPGFLDVKDFISPYFETIFKSYIDVMEMGWWIDERTRLVQLGCSGRNPNEDQGFVAWYSVEFTPSGLVYPNAPIITTVILSMQLTAVAANVDAILLYTFYYLNEELSDLLFNGPKSYFIQSGWLNVLDLGSILMGFITWYNWCLIARYSLPLNLSVSASLALNLSLALSPVLTPMHNLSLRPKAPEPYVPEPLSP